MRRFGDRCRGVGDLERSDGGGAAELHLAERVAERLDRLERRERHERQRCEEHPVDRPRREPRGSRATSTADRRSRRGSSPAAALAPRMDARVRCSRPIERERLTEVRRQPVLATERGQVGQAGEIARQPRVQLRAGRISRSDGRRGAARAASGTREPAQREEREQRRARGAEFDRRRGSRTRDATARIAAAGGTMPRTKNASSVSTSATVRASRSPLAERAEPTRRERLDRSEEPDPDLRQDPEGGEMRDVPLRVAQRRASDRERADRRDGHRERREPRHQRGLRDQVRRGRHQRDVRGERAEARQHRQEHPPPDRRGERQQPPERASDGSRTAALERPAHG